MNVLGNYLDNREDSAREQDGRRDRGDVQLNTDGTPENRLVKFDAWVRAELEKRLVWPADSAGRKALIEQCRIELDKPVLELWRRGWLLDGKRLAKHITAMLDAVGAAQRAGKVGDFWPYYRAAVNRYVGANAEEIQADARSLGSHMGNFFKHLIKPQKASEISVPELVAQRADETLREKLTRERRRLAIEANNKAQMKFL